MRRGRVLGRTTHELAHAQRGRLLLAKCLRGLASLPRVTSAHARLLTAAVAWPRAPRGRELHSSSAVASLRTGRARRTT